MAFERSSKDPISPGIAWAKMAFEWGFSSDYKSEPNAEGGECLLSPQGKPITPYAFIYK
jgi:hypothetical protein